MNAPARIRLVAACVAALSLAFVSGAQSRGLGEPVTNGLVAFVTDRDGSREIYVMQLSGMRQTRITDSHVTRTGIPASPSWSPDRRIVFATYVGRWEIYSMEADGTEVDNLTDDNGASNFDPSWSPDGTKILFRKETGGPSHIWVMNADGSDPISLTNDRWSDFNPSWSPDGTKIAFDRVMDGNSDIWIMNADGSDQTNVTNDAPTELKPSWSPDGRVAFVRRLGANSDIWTMNADGSSQTRLTTDPADDTSPAWSPEGQYILFVTNRDGQYEIYGMKTDDTTQQVDLTDSSPASDLAPAWQTLPGPPPDIDRRGRLPDPHGRPRLDPNYCPGTRRQIKGTRGDNKELWGTKKADVICGLGGNDIIRGLGGKDEIYPGSGKDLVYAGAGDDVIVVGGDGTRDIAWGERGANTGTYDPRLDVVHQLLDPDR